MVVQGGGSGGQVPRTIWSEVPVPLNHPEPPAPCPLGAKRIGGNMKKKILLFILVVSAAFFVVSFGYLLFHRNAAAYATKSYKSDSIVKVTDKGGYIYFEPLSRTAETGLIYYPGGKIESKAYSPTARGLAKKGYAVAIPKFATTLPFFRIMAGDEVIKENVEIKKWVVAGHSLGGVVATEYLIRAKSDTKDKIKGIAFLASYPASDISRLEKPALIVTASEDKLITEQKIFEASCRFPKDYQKVIIAGGNHSQFGDYGLQPKDGKAKINVDEQTVIICEILDKFMQRVFLP